MTDGRHSRRLLIDDPASEASLLASLVKKPLSLLIIPVFLVLGLLVGSVVPRSYTATSEIIVEDNRASDPFAVSDIARPSTQASERYLADQVAVLRSNVTADRAIEILGGGYDLADIVDQTTVEGDAASNRITIDATGSNPEEAKAIADAMAQAYADIRRDQVRAMAKQALDEVDGLIAAVDNDLTAIEQRISDVLAADTDLTELNKQFEDALAQFNSVRAQRDSLPLDSAQRADLNLRIEELLRDFQTWDVIYGTNQVNDQLTRLRDQRTTLVANRTDLEDRRNQISVNIEQARDGVNLLSPAQLPKEADGPGTLIVALLFAFVGALIAASVSYVLVHRRSRIESKYEPEEVLDAPLLGSLPAARATGRLAVVDDPGGQTAYDYRFAASALDLRTNATKAKTLLSVSAHGGEDRAVVVGNLAAALALSGIRVLVIDADFQSQSLTRHLYERLPRNGLVQLIAGWVGLDEVSQSVPLGGGDTLDVIPQSPLDEEGIALLRTSGAESVFVDVASGYDVVLIDAPAVLDAAYTATLARFVDGVLVVADFGMATSDIEELSDRLALVETPIIGYVFAGSPGGEWVATLRRMLRRPVPDQEVEVAT